MSRVYCLSVRQPWAALIVNGGKDVENRTWSTKYRGVLYIQASKRYDHACPHAPVDPARFMAIIGRVRLIDCWHWQSAFHIWKRNTWHEYGKIGWYFADPEILVDPIPYKGQLGVFKINAETSEQLLAAEYRPGRSYLGCNDTL